MSDNVQPQNNSEEVDLGQLFILIGNAFQKLFNFIGSIFRAIFSIIIFGLKAIIVNFKIILVCVVLAAILGFVAQKFSPNVFSSSMLVRPYFDSKYQLVTNVSYYNALIDSKNYDALSKIFEINKEDAETILNFEIEPGPETENDRIVQYDKFVKSIDSLRAQEISFDDYIENRSIYSGELFQVTVSSFQKDIFKKLEPGLNSSFTNEYSLMKKKKRDSMLNIQKENILDQLSQVDSLQKIYINVLEIESQSTSTEFSIGGEGFSLSNDKSNTREYELLEKEMALRDKLKELEGKKIDEDVIFDIISSFQEVGSKSSEWYNKYIVVFPMLAFLLLCLVYITKKTVVYVKNYEA